MERNVVGQARNGLGTSSEVKLARLGPGMLNRAPLCERNVVSKQLGNCSETVSTILDRAGGTSPATAGHLGRNELD